MIVNKKTPEIVASLRSKGLMYFTLTERYLYFPKSVAFHLGARLGLGVQFINDGDDWSFFIDEDPDAFPFSYSKGMQVDSRALCRMIQTSTGRKFGDRLFIHKTKRTANGHPIYEVLKASIETHNNKNK